MNDASGRLVRTDSWLDRATEARNSTDLDGRFIFYWIAFNSLYWQRDGRDIEDWKTFLTRIAQLAEDQLTASLDDLKEQTGCLVESEFLYEEYWEVGFTDNLTDQISRESKNNRRSPSLSGYLHNLFSRLYLLRNQVFHGSSKDGSGANRGTIEPAVAVLAALVPIFRDVVASHTDEDWGLIPFPAKGREGHPKDLRTR